MAKRVMMEEYRLTVFASGGLREPQYRAIRRALDSRWLRLDLSRAVRQVCHRYPASQRVRIRLSR
jgi:hypothetical protein